MDVCREEIIFPACPLVFTFQKKMNFYEFGVTQTIDWCDVKTVYVEAESSHEAIKFMLTLSSASNCDRGNEKFPFADFKFRTAIPFCCIERGATILRRPDQ